MAGEAENPAFDGPVPVFPLPNLVLFPGARQSLYIFEPRYRKMVADALRGPGLIAMALLHERIDADPTANDAEIHPIVCVGRIGEHVRLPDGRYFLNLEGICRARVAGEYREGPYRLASLDPVQEPDAGIEPDGAMTIRQAIADVLVDPVFDALDEMDRMRALLRVDVPVGRAIDVLAFRLVPGEEVEIKQQLLEELDVLRRGEILLEEIRAVRQILLVRQSRRDQWPIGGAMN